MESWMQDIFGWLPSGGAYYALVGAISFLESLAVIGIFCPGSILIVFAGFLAAHGKGSYELLAVVSALGAFAGDMISYLLGARLGAPLMQLKVIRKRRELLKKSEIFFFEHGGKSIFFGRFVGFLRPFIPFVAGSSQMSLLPFVLYALISGILWGVVYPGLGYFFGASWTLVRLWTGRFGLFFTLLLLLAVLNGIFWKKFVPSLLPWLSRRWEALHRRFLQSSTVRGFASRHPRMWCFLADRFSLQRGSGLYLTVGFAASLLFAMLFLWLTADLPILDRVDRQFDLLLAASSHPLATLSMRAVTSLADGPVIAMISGLVLLWLLLCNRDFSAVVLLVGVCGAEMLVFLLKLFFDQSRPLPFPGRHFFTALVLIGLVVYFFLGDVRNWRSRLALTLSGSLLATLIGFSRIYLGLHQLTDILAGFALGALWLTFLITASEMRRRYGGEFPWRAGWQPVRIPRPLRLAITAVASLVVLFWTVRYLLGHLAGS